MGDTNIHTTMKIFDKQFECKYQPKRVNEDVWFKQQQKLLLFMANTDYGRDLLCIDKRLPKIIEIGKQHVTGLLDIKKVEKLYQIQKISDFRIGAKWANIIRYRWYEFQQYAQIYYAQQHPFQFKMPILFPVAPVPGFNYIESTFFPNPDPETTSVDGRVTSESANALWADLRALADGTYTSDDVAGLVGFTVFAHTTTDRFLNIGRAFFLFDTSSIGDTDTIDSATFSIIATLKTDNDSDSIRFTTTTPASNTAIVLGDYDQIGTTANATDVTLASINVGGTTYTDWTLNATGLTNISKTSISKFGLRWVKDTADTPIPSWAASTFRSEMEARMAETAGTPDTVQDPKLVVTHTAAAAGGGNKMSMMGIGS